MGALQQRCFDAYVAHRIEANNAETACNVGLSNLPNISCHRSENNLINFPFCIFSVPA